MIHIVESASAKILGDKTADSESEKDLEQLKIYENILQQKNINCTCVIGYRNRVKEIARIVNEQKADLLVMGAHGHKGLYDYIYGETINEVRHLVDVPLYVVK